MEGPVIKELALNELCTVQSQLVLKSREIQKDTVVKGSGQLQPTISNITAKHSSCLVFKTNS